MTQINLPNRNITGDNLWSQVEDNDQAIVNTVNGAIDNGNIAAAADINASKLLDGSITAAKLGTDSVTNAKIDTSAVNTAEIANSAVTTAKIANDAVTIDKLDNPVTSGVTFVNGALDGDISLVATKYTDGLVSLSGWFGRSSPTSGTQYATLPSGYRPAQTFTAVCWVKSFAPANLGAGMVEIDGLGAIRVFWTTTVSGIGTPYSFHLDGLSFRAA